MIKIDFDEYDSISSIERTIELVTKTIGFRNAYILNPEKETQIEYVLTIISILYKQKCYQEYLEKITKTNRDTDIEPINEILGELNDCVQKDDFIEAPKIIKKHGLIIQEILTQYFIIKNTNYITEKHIMEVVIKQNKQKEILKYNPLIINQLLKTMQKPLTKEEHIIEDIIEFIIESEQLFFDTKEIFNNVKALMQNKYDEKEYDTAILFIISNLYQEIKEHPIDINSNMIISIVENKNITKEEIIKKFKEDNRFSKMILESFKDYSFDIKEGRLEELKTKPSKQYAKRIY